MNHARFLWQITGVLQRAMRRAMLVAALMAPTVAAGCSGGGGGPATCPNDYPTSCPVGAPTFAADVAPMIHARCTICHAAGQQIPTLDTHDQIMAASARVFAQIHACLMPPPPRPPLTSDERQTILAWIVCGTPND